MRDMRLQSIAFGGVAIKLQQIAKVAGPARFGIPEFSDIGLETRANRSVRHIKKLVETGRGSEYKLVHSPPRFPLWLFK